jgi:hypothetical protein
LSDWEIGTTQMLSGAVDANCYRFSPFDQRSPFPPLWTVLEHMHPPTQMFHPDGQPPMVDLGIGRMPGTSFDVKVRTADHPGYETSAFASAHLHERVDDFRLARHRHRGFFYTYVVARQKSTAQIIPLYTARWWLASDFEHFQPDRKMPFEIGSTKSLTFAVIHHHPFTRRDFFPVVAGETMQQLSKRRQTEWRTDCPGFVELGGGQ